MDKNSIIGFVLLGILAIAYVYMTAPSPEELEKQRRTQDSIALVQKQQNTNDKPTSFNQNNNSNGSSTLNQQNNKAAVGSEPIPQKIETGTFFSDHKSGEEKVTVLENNITKLSFTNKGGRIKAAELKDFKTWDSKPVILFEGDDNRYNYQFSIGNYIVNTQDLIFKVNKKGDKFIQYKANADKDSYILQTYSLKDNDYLIDYNLEFVGFDNIIPPSQSYITLEWSSKLRQQEKVTDNERMMTSVFYENADEDVDYCNCNKTEDKKVNEGMKWVSFKQQFFNQSLIPEKKFESGDLEIVQPEEDDLSYLKLAKAQINIPYMRSQNYSYPMQMYFGPNDYSVLKTYDNNLNNIIPLGKNIFGWMNRNFIIPIFNFLNRFISSYGIIIIVLTLIIKLLLFPLTYKTYQSSAKMKVLKPDIEEINKKYEKDKQKAQMETMGLYRKAGVNPAGGCLPTLLQMPILFAMYRFFPSSIELRQQSFLWAEDLSTYDSILSLPFEIPLYGAHVSLFTLLMTLSSFLYMRMNSQMTPTTNDAMASQMKMMQYFMPVMFLGIFNKLAAALTFYFFLSNMISYLQQWVIKTYFIDEEKLKKKIAINKLKKVKKSKWQTRLEDMQKQAANGKKKKK